MCSTARKATFGSPASASRSARVRWAVSSVTSRSDSGRIASSSSGVSISGPVGAPPMVMTARWRRAVGADSRWARRHHSPSTRLDRRFVLRQNQAAIDTQTALVVDADEDAGAGHVGRIVTCGPVLEGRYRDLDLAEPLVDRVGEVVGLRVLLLKGVMFSPEGGEARLLLLGEGDRRRRRGDAGRRCGRRGNRSRPRSTSSPRIAATRLRPGACRSQADPVAPESCSQPPSSCWKRSRRIAPPAASKTSRPTNCARRSAARTAPSVSWRRMEYGSLL